MTYLLDTNIISAIMKGNDRVKNKVQEVLMRGEEVLINCISYFEIKRGLLAADAYSQLEKFNSLCEEYGLVYLDSRDVLDHAAEIYAVLQRKGQGIGDADVLIASMAKMWELVLVSANVAHFQRIEGLRFENWMN